MPQDNLRSFVSCGDPQGVVECIPIRKSKTYFPKMKGKFENKNLSSCSSYKKERSGLVSNGVTEELDRSTFFQLMEVSKGAQKLNQVFDSWFKGGSFSGKSKDGFAKDLLRGSLDLEESLSMLSKMQEAPKYTTRLKNKKNEKSTYNTEEVGIWRSQSDRYGYQDYQNIVSTEGSSRDCFEELREVIRESLAKQNMLPSGSSEAKANFDRKQRELSADLLSHSSSRSSTTYSHDFASSDSSVASKVSEDKPKASNLVAKLMGLDEIPSNLLQSGSRENLEKNRKPNQRGLIFDIDMPKGTKPRFAAQNVDREYMTLDQIIENMQFKGLLNRDPYQIYHSYPSHTENKFGNNSPPIVLMKPIRPDVEVNNLFFPKKGHVDFEKRPSVLKTKEGNPSKMMEHRKEVLSSNMGRNSYFEKTRIENISQANVSKLSKKAQQKAPAKKVKVEELLSYNETKLANFSNSRQHEDVTGKKDHKVPKTTNNRKKSVEVEVEVEIVKSASVLKNHEQPANVSRSHEQRSTSSAKPRKTETGPYIENKDLMTKKNSIKSKPIAKGTQSVVHQSERDHRKSTKFIKPVNEALATNVGGIVCKDDDTPIGQRNKSDIIVKDTTPATQLLVEKEFDNPEIHVKDIHVSSHNPVFEDAQLTIQHESDTNCGEEATHCTDHQVTRSNSIETRASNAIFSRSLSLFIHVEDLFDNIHTYQPIVLQIITGLHGYNGTNSKLLMDCANEQLESRSQRHIPAVHPLIQRPMENPRFFISSDHLMEEVRDEIEGLIRCSNRVGVSNCKDAISALLKRDLWCKGGDAGAWEMGWRDELTGVDVQKIGCDLDKLVLDELIEEVLADFCCNINIKESKHENS